MILKTWLPIFTGFYGTWFECECEEMEMDHINSTRQEAGLDEAVWEDFTWDYDSYHNRVSEACVAYVNNELNSIFDSKLEVDMEEIISPKEYNFSNDAIDIQIKAPKKFLKELKKYLKDNKEAFEKYLDRYVSCDGFMSFYRSDLDYWMKNYFPTIDGSKEFEGLGSETHILGSLLQFVMENEGITDRDMADDACSEMYVECSNYNELCVGVGEMV